MISCIFTIDYEIYGNGEGRLKDLVYEPTQRMLSAFRERELRFVAFVEAAELEMIEKKRTDPAIDSVKRQIQDMHATGFELGLHLHPQWCNADFIDGRWNLDYREYNLCVLPPSRIADIVQQSLDYLRRILGESDWTPLAFRAGNWLLQPTDVVANVLAQMGVKIDSSVFKGGLQRNLGLDYRPACGNGYSWRFYQDVNTPDPAGVLLELPTYTEMVPIWRIMTGKRFRMHQRGGGVQRRWTRITRYLDILRFHYPLKLDFCRMTMKELSSMMENIVRADILDPSTFKPVVAIGHTKDLTDLSTIETFLDYLRSRNIKISTFRDVWRACGVES